MKKEIILEVNDTYSFELESHEGGGYSWTLVSNDEEVTDVQFKQRNPAQDIVLTPIGKSLPVKVEIKALAKGKSMVLLEETRVWEKNARPLNSSKIIITVK